VAFTISFPTAGSVPEADALQGWLTERGEPIDREGPHTVTCRALPVRFNASPDQTALQAQFSITSAVLLPRLVSLIFDVSVYAGADVVLAGVGPISRPVLWMHLADEQDRQRITEALSRAEAYGNLDEVAQGLWTIVAALRPDCDDRWDTSQCRVLEVREVGAPNGIGLKAARWHNADAQNGDLLPVPVREFLHTVAWRWLSASYPRITE
jgi:hypothetical protein